MPAFLTWATLSWAAAAAVTTEGARILAVETIPGRSHWNFMSAVLRALTDAGHHVTAFTAFPEGGRENYAEVDTSVAWPPRVDRDVARMAVEYGGPFVAAGRVTAFSRACCDALRADRTLAAVAERAARNATRFDAVVVEPAAGGADCTSWLAAAVRAPVLILAVATPMLTASERAYTGHASNPATVANVFAGHGVPRTFARRLANAALWAYGALRAEYDLCAMRLTAAAAAADPWPYGGCGGGGAYATVRPALVFVNSHHATEAPRPVPSNVVDVGGIHLTWRRGETERRVPEDILDFIEDSPYGVILFTFGSTIRLSSLPKHIEDVFKRVLANVPQRVLWKYETVMDDMPDNVMIKKWFPQREILLHPKVKLFISHGGISGVYEAVDASVPVLGFPLFFDQIRNIEHLVDAEMAISLNLFDVSYDVLFNAITELINNEKYTENAKIASNRFKDRPMSPSQSVVYWTEYVIRHRGAPHLRSHAFDLTWYQYLLLDVIAAILACVFLVLFYVYKVFKTICDYFTIIHLVIKLHNKSNK